MYLLNFSHNNHNWFLNIFIIGEMHKFVDEKKPVPSDKLRKYGSMYEGVCTPVHIESQFMDNSHQNNYGNIGGQNFWGRGWIK
jgi:hypothetical protein